MAFNEDKAMEFLEKNPQTFDESKATAFLEGRPIETTKPAKESKSLWRSVGEYAAGGNDIVLSVLGLPGDAHNWVMEKVGSDRRVIGTDYIRSKFEGKVGTIPGEEPDSAAYKAGTYTGMGLAFLAPWLRLGKGSLQAVKTGQAVQSHVGVTKGIAQRITAPFITSPKTAVAGEVAGSIGAGLGAYYGEKAYGKTGELYGGLIGGIAPQPIISNLSRISNYTKTSLFPYTKPGAKMKAGLRLRTLAETIDAAETIKREQDNILPKAKLSPAKLSGDRHFMALEKEVLKDDPILSHQFKLKEAEVSALARKEAQDLGGDVPIEQTQAYLKGRIEHVKDVISQRMTKAITIAQRELEPLNPSQRRRVVNTIVNKQIDDALTQARSVEKEAWKSVDDASRSTTETLKKTYFDHLLDRTKSSDPDDIPVFVETFLGKLKNGALTGGKYKDVETIKDLTTFRSRILNTIRDEKAKDAPRWNKVRILNDLQESVLKDIETSPASDDVTKALAISRELNEKFSGGVMDAILGHEKTGGKLASELTLEAIKKGPKAAVEINRVLAASPESRSTIEEFVKIQIASSNVVKNGRINLTPAKKYMMDNEDVLDIFPDVKKSLNDAIGAEERATWLTATSAQRIKGVEGSMAAKVSSVKPGRVLNEILTSPNPELQMKKIINQSNKLGRAGIKNDIVDYLFGKSKTGLFDENDMPILSGRRFASELEKNKKIFSNALTKDEMKRLNIISETMKKNEGLKDLPEIGGVIDVKRTPLSWALEVVAVRAGSKLGAKTHGAALKTAQMAGSVSRKLLGDLDVGRARKLIKDAIQDPELFRELISDHTTQAQLNRFYKVYHSWLMVHAVENINEKN